ncbi:MAG: fibronectin type III domain-containing protein [Pseudomonadota bacterium]
MKRFRCLVLTGIVLLFSITFISCASAPEVAQEELLTSGSDEREMKGRIYVSPNAGKRLYQKVAVMPFRAPAELAGASMSDLFATELLYIHKYELVERSQMEQVLGEQALGLKGVTESALAMRVGKILNAQGVIVGTVPEYGSKASGKSELAAIGLNVRMIDVKDGSIVWSLSDTAISDRPISISAFANRMVRNLVAQLLQEMIRVGDTQGMNIPSPVVVNTQSKIRGVVIDIQPDSLRTIKSYKILRSRTEKGPYHEVGTLENMESGRIQFEDRDLLDAETYYYKVYAVTKSDLTSFHTEPLKITTTGPPHAVSGLVARPGLIRKVVLTWQPINDPNIRGYSILRKSAQGNWEKINTVEGQTQNTYADEKLGDETTYTYRVVSVNLVGTESPPSAVVTATTKGAPSPVKKPEAVSNQVRKVTLSWNPVNEPEVKGYVIFRAVNNSGPFKEIAFVEGREVTRYEDGGKKDFWSTGTSLNDGARYFYKVRAVNVVDVHSLDSPMAYAVTKPVPRSVTGLQASQGGVKQVMLRWKPNVEEDIIKYTILRGYGPTSVDKRTGDVSGNIHEFSDQGLDDGTKYYYRVRAVDKDGLEGQYSETVLSTTKPVPSKPTGVQALLETNQIRLSWKPNGEKDITKYVVGQKGFFTWDRVGESAGPEYFFRGEMKKGKTLTFRIIAVDQTNLEGAPSEEISITIP